MGSGARKAVDKGGVVTLVERAVTVNGAALRLAQVEYARAGRGA